MPRTAHALGAASYDRDAFGAAWWLPRARDRAHQRAYRLIADAAAAQVTTPGATVIDYACGPGLLLAQLGKRLPTARLAGLDESRAMLDAARAWLGQELGAERALAVALTRTTLPDFALTLPRKAALAVFSFPDFRCDLDGRGIRHLRRQHPEEWAWSRLAARCIRARARADDDCDPDDDTFQPARLFYERLAVRHMRALVRARGGLMRVDYALGTRAEWVAAHRLRHDWTLGCWAPTELGRDAARRARFATLRSARYHPSAVIRDVHAQNADPACLSGGLLISTLRARW